MTEIVEQKIVSGCKNPFLRSSKEKEHMELIESIHSMINNLHI